MFNFIPSCFLDCGLLYLLVQHFHTSHSVLAFHWRLQTLNWSWWIWKLFFFFSNSRSVPKGNQPRNCRFCLCKHHYISETRILRIFVRNPRVSKQTQCFLILHFYGVFMFWLANLRGSHTDKKPSYNRKKIETCTCCFSPFKRRRTELHAAVRRSWLLDTAERAAEPYSERFPTRHAASELVSRAYQREDPDPLPGTVVRQYDPISCYGSRQILTSPSNSVLRLIRIAHARWRQCLSVPRQCLMLNWAL